MESRVKRGEEISPMRKKEELKTQLGREREEEKKEIQKKIRYIERKTEMLRKLHENEGEIIIEDRKIYKIGDKIKIAHK